MLGGYRRAVVVVACVGRLDPRVRLFRQRGDHVRKHVVRQPASAVVVGLARPHPVTRSAWVACNAVCALARVIPRRQESASRADRKVRLPLRTGTAVGVQHERRAEGHTTICGANVENVAGITASAVLSIDQVNEIVDSSRLSPALVPPVGTKIGKHAGKVTGSRYTRSGEGCASIGVTPRATPIGGFEDEVGVVVRETTAAFVHARNVYGPAARKVARDLHVAHKGSLSAHHHWAAPSGAAISRRNDKDVSVGLIKVVPGNVQSPEKRRSGVVISPARFAIGRALVESAEMSPAIRVVGREGLVAIQTLTAAGRIEPNRNPIAGSLVGQNNGIAKGIVEGALTSGLGEPGKSGAAIGGDRCARNVDGVKVAAP